MDVLIVGGGGREHALAWKIAQSDRATRVYCAPGNAGTARIAENILISAEDIPALLAFAREKQIGLTIVGPEDPLCAGIVDRFEAAGLRIFGPCAAAAKIEGDKAYAKKLMRQAAIPTAEGRVFENHDQARDYVASREHGLVVKAAGLAKGKGVLVCDDPSKALIALEKVMVEKAFGDAGDIVVVEEKLSGAEISMQALVDGRNIYLLDPSQDHKPIGEGDTGPNTGGMGAYCPAVIMDEAMLQRVFREILVPIVDALNRQGNPYKGVLYVGLMLTVGGPKVLEFNARFGDPETQVILPRLRTDFIDIAEAVIDGKLDQMTLDWDRRPAVCVVMSSEGYPGSYEKGKIITGVDEAERLDNVAVFHAGTAMAGQDLVTKGGRVLGVTALGDDVKSARDLAYRAVDTIQFEGAYCRRDIAHQALTQRMTS